MTISSRTPEGDPNSCPICGQDARIDKSAIGNDAPCPACGGLLSFDSIEEGCVDLTREFLRSLRPLSRELIGKLNPDFLELRHAIVLGMSSKSPVVGVCNPDAKRVSELREHVSPDIITIKIRDDFYSKNVFRQRQRLRMATR